MPEGWEEVRYWRRRAEELRGAAENLMTPSARDALINIAEKYERMAAELERRLKDQGIRPNTAVS